ncbi:MAG: hypothetical protein RL021_2203 [Bacteroidota bacterium]|jgi:peptidoglycan/LPS O-acetylase OafA/YrhL
MIQRIQTLFLLVVALLSALLFYIPVYTIPVVSPVEPVAGNDYLVSSNTLLSIINGSVGILSLVCIFLFRNRNLQMRLANVNLLLICILIGLLFFLADTLGTTRQAPISYGYGSYLPLIQLIFTFLASRAIRKDEELVRSADRLR